MDIIKFEHVQKSYERNIKVIDDINLNIKKGEFVTLIGKSGCGKTTLLKLINGLIKADSGKIYIDNKEINDWNIINLRRNIGYVIQQIGLFPHMNIEENIGYVLNIKNVNKKYIRNRVKELINLVGLDETYLTKYPRVLSGGQKQRVGVARALASDPEIILMDEPFGAVDEITRKILQDEILNLQQKLRKTIIFVTHDIEEAFKLGSKIILFDKGKVVQCGSKEDIIFNPSNDFVENFFGIKNFIAYLNCTKINNFITELKKNTYINDEICLDTNMCTISKNASIMEAIRALFYNKMGELLVEDEKGNIIGKFSIRSIKKFNI